MSKPADLSKTPEIPFELLRAMNPNWQDVLLSLSNLVTDEVLRAVAAADYGYKEEKLFIILKEIVTSQTLPIEIDYTLMECLELTRWLEPKNVFEHQCRAFSCALLLIYIGELGYMPLSDDKDTLISLIESAAEFESVQEPVQALLAWRILVDYEVELAFYLEDEEDKDYIDEIATDPFYIYALLLIMLINGEKEEAIKRVLEWSVDTEKDWKGIPPYDTEYRTQNMTIAHLAQPYLLGTANFNQRRAIWQSMSKRMLEVTARYNDPMLKRVLTAVGNNRAIVFRR
jgi:hypothetical protein